MSSSSTPNTPQPSPEANPKPPRADQDQRIANDLNDWLKLIKVAKEDAEIAPILEGRGYKADDYDEGLELQNSAALAFKQRQTAWGDQLRASQTVDNNFAVAHENYVGFRKIGRKVFPEAGDQAALGLNGRIPGDLEKFITNVTASYEAAKEPPYTAKLTNRGYSPEKLGLLIAGIKALTDSSKAQRQAEGKAQGATKLRDDSYELLHTWIKEFTATAEVELRKRPDLLAKLGM